MHLTLTISRAMGVLSEVFNMEGGAYTIERGALDALALSCHRGAI
jgi:hypothetical protein